MNITAEPATSLINESFFNNTKDFPEKEVFNVDWAIPAAPLSFLGKIIYGLGSIVTLGLLPLVFYGLSRLLAKCVLSSLAVSEEEKYNLKEIKKAFIKYEQKNVQEFDLKTSDGATINGMAIFKGSELKTEFLAKSAGNQKWIIRFNGRNGLYETNLLRSQSIGKDLDANILVFNYRGVGDSKGILAKPEDLITDGEACIRYLLSKGVQEENILIHGTSLGGGIGTQVACLHEKIALINERSFASLSLAASVLAKFSIVRGVFNVLGWELDSIRSFEKVKAAKLIIFHKQDAIISYHQSSLYKIFKECIKKQSPSAVEQSMRKGRLKNRLKSEYKPLNIKLQRKFKQINRDAHLYYVQNDDAYPEIKKFVKKFFAS